MNPPYSLAMDFVLRSLQEIRPGGTIVALLRLQWLASADRALFHKRHPSHVFILDKRPSFCAVWRCHPKDPRGLPGDPKRGETTGQMGCGWTQTTLPDAVISACPRPNCGNARLRVTRNDSADYGWFVWHESIMKGRWSILKVEGIGRRRGRPKKQLELPETTT